MRDSEGNMYLDPYYHTAIGPGIQRLLNNNKGRRRRCNARIPKYIGGSHQQDYFWCAEIAQWKRGEQELCHFHAGMVIGGKLPVGITNTGKWGA